MRKHSVWIATTLLLAMLLHVVGLWVLPRYITASKVAMAVQRSGGYNRMVYARLHAAGEDKIVMDNPDVMYSSAAYDVSKNPVRVRCVVPDLDSYWSLALYAWNTDNFFVINDRSARAKSFDLIIASAASRYQKRPDEELVIAPTDRGVLLVRMVVNDRNNQAELTRMAALQKQTVIQAIDTVSPDLEANGSAGSTPRAKPVFSLSKSKME